MGHVFAEIDSIWPCIKKATSIGDRTVGITKESCSRKYARPYSNPRKLELDSLRVKALADAGALMLCIPAHVALQHARVK